MEPKQRGNTKQKTTNQRKKKHKIPQNKYFSVMIETSIDKSFLAPTYVTQSTFPPLSDLGHRVEHVPFSSPETQPLGYAVALQIHG